MKKINFPASSWMDGPLRRLSDAYDHFYERECTPQYDAWEKQGSLPRGLRVKADETGLLGVEVPEQYDDPGGTFAHDLVIAYPGNLAGIDGWGGELHNSIVFPYFIHYGLEQQKKSILPRMSSGALIGGISMTEPGARSDLKNIKTVARRDGDHCLISGSKTFITNGHLTNLIIVAAKTDPGASGRGISPLGVKAETVEGFRRGHNLDKLGVKFNGTSDLFFDDMRVPSSALSGPDEGKVLPR